MTTTTIRMTEVKDLLNYTIDNNKVLEDEMHITPIGIAFQADAGIGKTSVVKQVAEERNMGFTKINVAQMDEVGDIIGYPITEYECQIAKKVKDADGNVKAQILPNKVWLTGKQIDSYDKNTLIRQTGKTRMSYAKPAWVPEYNENGNILLLDDYTRGTKSITQALMDLIWEHKYISWTLPKHTTVVLTTNPDNGNYNVIGQDEAEQTRYLLYDVMFDLDAWARWAEKENVDGRCINFVLSYHEQLFNADADGNRICNPRSFVMFTNMIRSIKNWDTPESLSFINTISKGCFKDEGGKFSSMFNLFIRNKMHLLVQPKEMLLDGWNTAKDKLENTLYDSDGKYRPDIASLLERRFINYVNSWLDSPEKTPVSTITNRLIDFIDNEEKGGKMLFSKDLIYHMVKSITSDHKNQTNKLLFEPKIAMIIS